MTTTDVTTTATITTATITTDVTDEIQRRFGPDPHPEWNDPNDPDRFWESACEEMLKEEAKWKQGRQTFAWIDEKPVWVGTTDWDIIDVMPDPEETCTRVFRLSLLGGGQIKVTEEFSYFKVFDDSKPWLTCHGRRHLRVQAETPEGLRTVNGFLANALCEMGADAVVFPGRVPQAITDRVAATFRLVGSRDDFMALLLPGERCCVCGRTLTDQVSKLLNIGPSCAKLLRLPHDIATANRVLARRRELLGDNH